MSSLLDNSIQFEAGGFYSTPPKLSYSQEVDGRYAMQIPLGRGGDSMVYRSLDVETGSAVDLKVPNVSNEDVFDRIVREACLTSVLLEETEDSVPYIQRDLKPGNIE